MRAPTEFVGGRFKNSSDRLLDSHTRWPAAPAPAAIIRRMTRARLFIPALAFVTFSGATPVAQHWPHWRGPTHDGVSLETNLPVSWGAECKPGSQAAEPAATSGSSIRAPDFNRRAAGAAAVSLPRDVPSSRSPARTSTRRTSPGSCRFRRTAARRRSFGATRSS